MSTFSWLHISDLHFKSSLSVDQSKVLTALLKDINGLCSGEVDRIERKPDLILITGDLAFSGDQSEYKQAREFLSRLYLASNLGASGTKRTLVVPGNHDLKRCQDKDLHIIGYDEILFKGIADQKEKVEFDRYLKLFWNNPARREAHFMNFANYADFLRSFLPTHPEFTWEKPFFRVWLSSGSDPTVTPPAIGTPARSYLEVIGLCSPWIGGMDEEDGRLVVGACQLDDVFSSPAVDTVKSRGLRIAMMHHPFRSVHNFDIDYVNSRLSREVDCILHGHRHREYFHQEITPDTSTFFFSAGAAYERPDRDNTYSFVTADVSDDGGKLVELTVILRKYHSLWNKYTADVSTFSCAKNGIIRIRGPHLDIHDRLRETK